MATGKITQVIGTVVDVEFPSEEMPAIFNAVQIQKEGEPVQEVDAGGAVSITPGEKHWHGASLDTPMVHLALNIDAHTTWMAKVSDSDYNGTS